MRPSTERYGLAEATCDPVTGGAIAAAGVSSGQMLTRLTLTNFRNYGALDLKLVLPANNFSSPCPVVLTGPNGAGKTNLLEAISYLAPGRGIRGARLGDLTRIGAISPWTVSARIETLAGEIEVGSGMQVGEQENGEAPPERLPERRTVRIDGASSSPAGLARVATILWLTPRMDRLFVEGTSARRRFLDRMVQGLHGGHGREIAAYEKAMRDRLNLLTHHGLDGGDPAWLAALECSMAEHGVAIAAARIDTIGHLTEQIQTLPDSPFPKAVIGLEGLLEAGLQEKPALQVEEGFAATLAANRGIDARSGRTSDGPHRSDLLTSHMAKGLAATLCSTGEQKALLTGLLLANAAMLKAREDRAPILLLDEIAAHMDETHRSALFANLLDLGCQAWLTGTDMALFSPLGGDAVRYSVEGGQLEAA